MTLRRLLLYSLLSTSVAFAGSLVPRDVAVRQYAPGTNPGPGNGGGYGGPPVVPTSQLPSRPAPSSAAVADSSSLKGDSKCGATMCITAIVLNSTIEYTLASSQQPGWMAMGWGSQMVGSPIVLMWANSDGSVTISQRLATAYQMPTVDPSPPKVASLEPASFASTSSTKFIFTVPNDGSTSVNVIYAFGNTKPSSSQPDATIVQHIDQGTFELDLSHLLTEVPNKGAQSGKNPLAVRHQMIAAHAVFVVLGFLVALPAGALLARFTRSFTVGWFKGHWILQFPVAGLFILIGVALGITAVAQDTGRHLSTTHRLWGVILFVLYIVQCSLGAFIHFVKDPNRKGRPPQNYVHAVLGLLIIATALYQVHTGFSDEYPTVFGTPVSTSLKVVWFIWVVILPLLYGAGLTFLPRQFRQEANKLRSNQSMEEMSYLGRS